MKKSILFALAITITTALSAQKFAFVDTEYILENLPGYQEAQKELDASSEQWQKTIEAKYAEIDQLYKTYQAEQVLLTDEMKRKREDEIITKEKEAKEYQQKMFGVDGELFKKREELVKPIQDEIYEEIKKLAKSGSYAVVFDKGQANILYGDARYDKSDEILRKLKL